jgi:N-acetylglutamate synthase-like GNAT family acetyltransferase
MANQIQIRTAHVGEREALEALQQRASWESPGDREGLLAIPRAIELPAGQIESGSAFVAVQDGMVLGFAAMLRREEGRMELDGLFVKPGHWRRGIGRSLVEHCEQVARLAGSPSLHVVGITHASGFCERRGFECVGTTPLRFGSGLRLVKPVREPHSGKGS